MRIIKKKRKLYLGHKNETCTLVMFLTKSYLKYLNDLQDILTKNYLDPAKELKETCRPSNASHVILFS